MRITPIDIQQHQFKTRPLGYEKGGVDHYLELVADELERLNKDQQELQEELARTRAALEEMRDRETTLKNTLLTAQKMTDELKANARKEAENTMVEANLTAEGLVSEAKSKAEHELSQAKISAEGLVVEAQLRAERIVRDADDRRIQLVSEIQEIKRQKISFETGLRALLENHVRMLDLEVVTLEGQAGGGLLEDQLPFDAGEEGQLEGEEP